MKKEKIGGFGCFLWFGRQDKRKRRGKTYGFHSNFFFFFSHVRRKHGN